MIDKVTFIKTTYHDLPHKFEAGTPMVAEAAGLAAAIEYLNQFGMDEVRAHEIRLTSYALQSLNEKFGEDISIYGPSEPEDRGGVLSFTFADIHPHDVAQVLDEDNICIRAGHHCAKPLMRALGIGASSRASLYINNDESEVAALISAVDRV